jgi:hypothetical protein
MFKFFKLSNNQKYDVLIILIELIRAFVIVKCIPTRYYYRYYFSPEKEGHFDIQNTVQPSAMDICLFNKIVKIIPLKITCLMESMAAKSYFKKRNISFPIIIGINTKGELNAHAWYKGNPMKPYNHIFSL